MAYHRNKYRPIIDTRTFWQRWVRCSWCGKRGYTDKKTARAVRRDQLQEFREKASALNIYKCEESGLFHLGHASKIEEYQPIRREKRRRS